MFQLKTEEELRALGCKIGSASVRNPLKQILFHKKLLKAEYLIGCSSGNGIQYNSKLISYDYIKNVEKLVNIEYDNYISKNTSFYFGPEGVIIIHTQGQLQLNRNDTIELFKLLSKVIKV